MESNIPAKRVKLDVENNEEPQISVKPKKKKKKNQREISPPVEEEVVEEIVEKKEKKKTSKKHRIEEVVEEVNSELEGMGSIYAFLEVLSLISLSINLQSEILKILNPYKRNFYKEEEKEK